MFGPIDYIVVSFPGNNFNGDILPELEKAINSGVIRLLDLAFVQKDAQGNVVTVELTDMSDDIVQRFSAIRFESSNLLSEDDLSEVAEALENESSAGVLVVEQVWAKGLKQAIIASGGQLLADGRIRDDVVEANMAELDAIN